VARNARLLVAALAAVLCVAVVAGVAAGGALPEDSQLIENWNGAAWTITPATPPVGGSALNAVTTVSPADLWAVGSSVKPQGGTSSRPLVERYNDSLSGIAAVSATDVWAVGDSNAP
jgi:hypothetical protein